MSQGRVRVGPKRGRAGLTGQFFVALLATAPLVMPASNADAAVFASRVVSYAQGTGSTPGFRNPQSAVGAPDPITGENPAEFPSLVTPFSPPYQANEIVSVGEGGHLTLELSHYALPGPGAEIGIFSNAGLVDTSFPNGQNTNPATIFSPRRPITVEVSADGVSFVPVSSAVRLDVPTLFYSNAGPFDLGVPSNPQATDFGIPFAGSLSSFDGKNWAQTVAAYNTGNGFSAGGTWIDISDSGLDRVGYIRLGLADDGPLEADSFVVDAVSIANTAVGAAVPEPAALGLLACLLPLLTRRSRR